MGSAPWGSCVLETLAPSLQAQRLIYSISAPGATGLAGFLLDVVLRAVFPSRPAWLLFDLGSHTWHDAVIYRESGNT